MSEPTVRVTRARYPNGQITAVSNKHEDTDSSVEISMAGIDMEIRVVDCGDVAGTYVTMRAWREMNEQVERMYLQQTRAIARNAKKRK